MEKTYEFNAPTGDELQGTFENVSAAASCLFTGEDPGEQFEHDGSGTNAFWDGMVTQSLCGATMFICASGLEWPAHHLIPADAEPLSAETLRLFAIEHALGVALDAATASVEALRATLKLMGSVTPETSELITLLTRYTERDRPKSPQRVPLRPASLVDHLTVEYGKAKQASIAAKDRELKAQGEASPRVSCDDCEWSGRERDCEEVQSLHARVAPGEIMPAGECPECGALCHLAEEETA
jgi:hypothetical protein